MTSTPPPAPDQQPPAAQPPANEPPKTDPPKPSAENGLAAFAGKLTELETRIAGLPEAIADALKESSPAPAPKPTDPPKTDPPKTDPPKTDPPPTAPGSKSFAERWFGR